MKKQRIGWILALSMVFTQNMGIWAEDLGPENIWEEPAYGEQIRLEELEEDYQDRFIVKYKTESVFRLSEVSPTDLTEAARQAYEKALEDKEQRVAETTVRQEAAAVEDSLSSDAHKFNMEERASVSAEEWKPGYLLFDLEEKIDPERFMEELEAIPGVEYIQPDYELELSDITLELEIIGDTPEESVSPEQTAEPAGIPEDVLGETGNSAETEESEATEDPSETQEPETEETSEPTAKPLDRMVKAAVIDGGVDVTHEAFTDRITDAWDFTADAELTYDPNRSDQYYHGTHVAGIIAKIAPNADIMPIQVFNQGRAYTSHIIDAIAYAQEHGAEIVNCSWGSTDENPLLKEAMEESDILFICAAGNSRMDIDETQVYPAGLCAG